MKYFLAAFFLHALLLTLTVYVNLNPQPYILPKQLEFPAYLATISSLPSQNKINNGSKPASSKQNSTLFRGKKSRQQPINRLLELLHQTIAQKTLDIANLTHATYTVQVNFALGPNGRIKDVHLIKRSGDVRLDNALLACINQAPPIHQAYLYLKQTERFNLEFIFD